jgi:hypothetical protein
MRILFVLLFVVGCGSSPVNVTTNTNTLAKNTPSSTTDSSKPSSDTCTYPIHGSDANGYSVDVTCAGEIMSVHNFTTYEEAKAYAVSKGSLG